mmetsp:Transcript_10146/g.8943  ORF Transcript_10146/g.8943 Transcript_10146/m.8943 type:complete len:113 (-) Transcript_10146:3-341(-)
MNLEAIKSHRSNQWEGQMPPIGSTGQVLAGMNRQPFGGNQQYYQQNQGMYGQAQQVEQPQEIPQSQGMIQQQTNAQSFIPNGAFANNEEQVQNLNGEGTVNENSSNESDKNE